MSKKSLRALLSALAIGGTLAVLLVVTMRGDAMYFREVDEVMAQPGASTANGANVDQWSWANVSQHKFQIIAVP